ncbi:Chaperone protein DnaJ [Cytospora mali]|uniref:Chaperone protein DnaJ n=1 Tax=Cytospora mali TaxID=578113 RepID=A0A194WCE6_CYTMA|nr:Chaperone protein DnaJ [Valsa mali]
MQRQQTAYETLGVLPTAPQSMLASAYHDLAKLYHPDKTGSTEDLMFLNSQYNKVKDPLAQQWYDEQLRMQEEPAFFPGPAHGDGGFEKFGTNSAGPYNDEDPTRPSGSNFDPEYQPTYGPFGINPGGSGMKGPGTEEPEPVGVEAKRLRSTPSNRSRCLYQHAP